MKFVKLTEYNDHEGEEWYFWLQKDDNDDELAKLQRYLDQFDSYGETYSLQTMGAIDEHDVDVLVQHGGQGYMNYHNKVKGKFTCPELTATDVDDGFDELNENFYKGRIQEHFK